MTRRTAGPAGEPCLPRRPQGGRMEALKSETAEQAQERAPVRRASSRWELWKAIGAVVRLIVVFAVMLAVYLVAPWDRRLDLPAGALLLGWLVVLALVVVLDVLAVLRSR